MCSQINVHEMAAHVSCMQRGKLSSAAKRYCFPKYTPEFQTEMQIFEFYCIFRPLYFSIFANFRVVPPPPQPPLGAPYEGFLKFFKGSI